MTCKERLTIKYGGAFAPKELCTIGRNGDANDCDNCINTCDDYDFDCGKCPIQKCFDRLGELEDKLENGTIIELPCKVGDTVWYIAFGQIYKGKVHAITFGGRNNVKGGQIHIYDYDKDNASLKLSEFNKTIFFTKEEAEVRLKELQNG